MGCRQVAACHILCSNSAACSCVHQNNNRHAVCQCTKINAHLDTERLACNNLLPCHCEHRQNAVSCSLTTFGCCSASCGSGNTSAVSHSTSVNHQNMLRMLHRQLVASCLEVQALRYMAGMGVTGAVCKTVLFCVEGSCLKRVGSCRVFARVTKGW